MNEGGAGWRVTDREGVKGSLIQGCEKFGVCSIKPGWPCLFGLPRHQKNKKKSLGCGFDYLIGGSRGRKVLRSAWPGGFAKKTTLCVNSSPTGLMDGPGTCFVRLFPRKNNLIRLSCQSPSLNCILPPCGKALILALFSFVF